MTKRKRRSIVRGNKIYVCGFSPPRWKPPIDRNIPIDYVRGERDNIAEDDWLPDEHDDERHTDDVGDEAAALAFLDEVLDEVLGNVGDVDDDDTGATDSAGADPAGEEPQPCPENSSTERARTGERAC